MRQVERERSRAFQAGLATGSHHSFRPQESPPCSCRCGRELAALFERLEVFLSMAQGGLSLHRVSEAFEQQLASLIRSAVQEALAREGFRSVAPALVRDTATPTSCSLPASPWLGPCGGSSDADETLCTKSAVTADSESASGSTEADVMLREKPAEAAERDSACSGTTLSQHGGATASDLDSVDSEVAIATGASLSSRVEDGLSFYGQNCKNC